MATKDPARRAAKAQNSRSFPTMIPGARVCLPMQAQRNSRACSEEKGNPVMAQGARVILPSDCGGSAISGLEGTGVLFAVGSQAIISAKDFFLTGKPTPASMRAVCNPSLPAS